MSDDSLLTRLDADGVLTVTLNRPAVKNAFDTATQRRMTEVFYDASRTPAARVVVLTGAGRSFSTGGDVKSLGSADPGDPLAQQYSADPTWGELEARVDRLRKFTEASLWLYRMGKPTIAMLRGPAAGAGLSLALACDFRFAADDAYFVTSFAKIGMSGDYGGSYFMTKLIGPAKTKELYMLSERLSAAEALRLGLITRLAAEADLEAQTYEFARRLAKGPAVALRYIKDNVHAALDEPLERACEVELRNMVRCRLTQDSREAMAAFAEKREPQFNGR
ncbi:MAG: enoyl-CoA hydratase [Steroidobacteraceae bacterium]